MSILLVAALPSYDLYDNENTNNNSDKYLSNGFLFLFLFQVSHVNDFCINIQHLLYYLILYKSGLTVSLMTPSL